MKQTVVPIFFQAFVIFILDIYSVIKNKSVWFHILFWMVYFSINLFTGLFLSSSNNINPSLDLFNKTALSHLLLLAIKIPAVYYVLYSLIPRWLKQPGKYMLFIEVFAALCFFVLAYRVTIHFVIWPYVTFNKPQTFTTLEFVARLFYSIFDILQVVGIAAAIKLFRLRINAIKNEKTLIQEKLQSEMRHLKSQINPHFLFNMLNSIYSLSRAQSASTPDTVMKLSKILRYMIYETDFITEQSLVYKEEIKIIDDFIELQQLRFGKRLQVKMEKSIDNSSTQVTPLLLFPLIENAFKHGNGFGTSEILFNISLVQNSLDVRVINPIEGSSVQSNGEEGIGLPNLRRQLELLYRDYSFVHYEKDNHFVVNLRINLASYAGFELFDSRG